MTAPAYSTDLATINLATGTWGEFVGAAAGGSPAAETDYFIVGSNCISETANATGLMSMYADYGSDPGVTSGAAIFIWLYFGAPNAIANLANGGYRVAIGDASGYNMWYVLGSDTYTYGGWVNIAVDPTVTPDSNYLTPSVNRFFGSVVNNSNKVAKGYPYANDAIRWGRTLQIIYGNSTDGYATFAGAAAKNDANNATDGYNRWGLFQAVDAGYLMKGLFLMGTASNAVEFVDSNKNIVIQNTTKVGSAFNCFEIRNSSSVVTWTNIIIKALGTVSRGNFIVTDNADVDLINCSFTDMGYFTFQSNSTIIGCTFRRCNLVTRGGATLENCIFDATNDGTKALEIDTDTRSLVGCTFLSGGTKHAIEITATGTYTFTDNTFTGYATSDGSTGDEVVFNNSGGEVTINHSGTVGTISVKNGSGASTTVSSSISITITVKDEADEPINLAFVFVDEDDTSPFIMNTQTNSSGIATGSYGGAASSGTLRVRKYGYKPFRGTVSLSDDINQGIVLIADPQQT